jgi:hypothetical protein
LSETTRSHLAHRLHPQALAVVVDLPGRNGEVGRLQARGQVIEIQAVRGQTVRCDRHFHLVGRRAGDLYPRHAGDAFEAALELALDHVVRGGHVAVAGQAHAQDRLVAAGPLEHRIALQVVRQVAADRIDAFARIGGGDGDVAVPVAELDEDAGRIGGGRATQALDAGHDRQRFFGRTQDVAFDFFRRGTRIR